MSRLESCVTWKGTGMMVRGSVLAKGERSAGREKAVLTFTRVYYFLHFAYLALFVSGFRGGREQGWW